MADNKLYYGDNLDVLRRHVPDESVDLVYLDPPFDPTDSNSSLKTTISEASTVRGATWLRKTGFKFSCRSRRSSHATDTWILDSTQVESLLLA